MPLFSLIGGWIRFILEEKVKKFTEDDKIFGKHLQKFMTYQFFSKILMLLFFGGVYITALVELIDYSEETFGSAVIAVINIIFSALTILLSTIILICISCFNCYNHDTTNYDTNNNHTDNDNKGNDCIKHLDYHVTILIFMFLGYFFPYMVIGFIQNPIQSSFIYALFFALIILLSILQISYLLIAAIFKDVRNKKMLFFTILLGALAFPYLLIMLISLFTLGGFDDFSDLKNIILPLLTSSLVSLVGIGIYYIKKE